VTLRCADEDAVISLYYHLAVKRYSPVVKL